MVDSLRRFLRDAGVEPCMEYKGYRASVHFDYEAKVLHGEVVDTRDVIIFEATSVDEIEREFHFSIDDYLAVCAERGREPDKPFSGRIPTKGEF